MKKIQKYSLVMLAGVGMISTYGATLVNAAAVGQYDSKSLVEFKQGTTVTPPVDPEDPDPSIPVVPIDPTDPTNPPGPGTGGPLAIDFASSLAFGEQSITSKDETYYAHPQAFDNGNTTENYVQVTDTRGNFAGWTLSVATDAQFHLDTVDPSVTDESSAEVGDYLTGAQLSFSGGHVTTEKGIDASIYPKEVKTGSYAVSTAETVIVAAAKNQGMGTWTYGLGTPTDYDTTATSADAIATKSPITLSVPGATVKKAGTYTTNLNWTLSDTPAN